MSLASVARRFALSSVLGSALVLSVATSPAQPPTLFTQSEEHSTVLAPGEQEQATHLFEVRLSDDSAYALQEDLVTFLSATVCIRAPGTDCDYVGSEEPEADQVLVELLDPDTDELLASSTVRPGGGVAVMSTPVLQDGALQGQARLRLSLLDASALEGPVELTWTAQASAFFDSLAAEDEEKIAGITLALEEKDDLPPEGGAEETPDAP